MSAKAHDHKSCRALFEKMSAFIDRELDGKERAEVAAHIRACCHCHACYETLRRTIELCRSSAEDFPLPDDLSEKLRALIESAGR